MRQIGHSEFASSVARNTLLLLLMMRQRNHDAAPRVCVGRDVQKR